MRQKTYPRKVIMETIKAAGYKANTNLCPDGIEPIRDIVEKSVADAVGYLWRHGAYSS